MYSLAIILLSTSSYTRWGGGGAGLGRDIGRMAVGSQTPDVQFGYNLILHFS